MGHLGTQITYPQKRDGGTHSENHQNLSNDDEIRYGGTPQLEPTTTTSVETKLLQPNEESGQIMKIVVT